MIIAAPDAEAVAAEAVEAHRVVELLGSESGVSEEAAVDLLLQRELSDVVSVALRDLLAKEVAPYVSAARRAAMVMGVMGLFIPCMFAFLVALATKAMLMRELAVSCPGVHVPDRGLW